MIRARYDEMADVLYVALERAKKAFVDEQPDGLLFRYCYEDQSPCGVTVIDFAGHWRGRVDQLASRISAFLSTPAEEIKQAVTRVAS